MEEFPYRERARWALCAMRRVEPGLGVSTSQLTLGRSPGRAAGPRFRGTNLKICPGREGGPRSRDAGCGPKWTMVFGWTPSGAHTEVRPPAALVMGPGRRWFVVGGPAGGQTWRFVPTGAALSPSPQPPPAVTRVQFTGCRFAGGGARARRGRGLATDLIHQPTRGRWGLCALRRIVHRRFHQPADAGPFA
jgi:hypothetical protein